jgi:hypothetical protein
MPDQPEPTEQDRQNAAIRQAIADRQQADYNRVLRLAMGKFGPGWVPSGRHFLVEKVEEDRARREGGPVQAAATVFTVKHEETGEKRHFTVGEDGKVTEVGNYEEGFGAMLTEPDPVRGFEHGGKWCPYHRYSLCWAPYELYHPRSAEQLASLRASRERGKTEREEKEWAAENPLLAWAERQAQEEKEGGHSGR